MNPIQAARKHCDCLTQDDRCLGITFRDDLSLRRFRPENSKCLLLGPKCQRCEHFESAILPMERRSDWPSQIAQDEFREAAHTYRMQSGALSQADRLCPNCNERALESRQRLCYICAKEKTLLAKRSYAAKLRTGLVVQKVDS